MSGASLERLPSAFAAIVLAGGESRRMGQSKALMTPLSSDPRPLVRIVVDRLQSIIERVIVVTRDAGALPRLDVEVVRDLPGKSDPLGAIATGLAHLRGHAERAFVCAVDMPGLHPPLVRELCLRASRGSADLVAPEGPRGLEPLHAVWSVSVADTLFRLHDGGLRRLQSLPEHLDVDVVPRSALVTSGIAASRSMTNVNTDQDLVRFLSDEEGE